MNWINLIILAGILIVLGGCTTYSPLPLSHSPKLAGSVDALKTQLNESLISELPLAWVEHPIDASNGLDETELILLALMNSPRIEIMRAQMSEAKAALYAAGLLPDPQFGSSLDFPASTNSSLTTGKNFSLGIDLQKIVTRNARRHAAVDAAQATWLSVLWQEWQIIQQARILYRRMLIQGEQQSVAKNQFQQAETIWKGQHGALAQGNATLDQEGLALATMMDARSAVEESRRQLNATTHDLHLLIGLNPEASVIMKARQPLESLIATPPTTDELQASLDALGDHRPDLLALRAGYRSHESKVREAILSQFPSFSVGTDILRDTGGLWTLGPLVNLNLPIFDGNRGNIAIARATRERLHFEYLDRLTSSYVQARKMAEDQHLAFVEWQALRAQLPHLAETDQRMARALRAGEIDMLTFTTLRTAYFSQQARVLMLGQVLLEQQVAIETLMGTLLVAPSSAEIIEQPFFRDGRQL